MPKESKSFIFSLVVHIFIFTMLIFISSNKEVVAVNTDPLMVVFSGENDGAAGIVGQKAGIAKGTQDGDKKFNFEYERQIEEPLPVQPQEISTPFEAPPVEVKPVAAKPVESKPISIKKSAEKNTASKTATNTVQKSYREWLKTKNGGKRTSGANNLRSSNGGKSSGKISGARINVNAYGTANGTGENGGDGGRGVSNAQALYASAVAEIFEQKLRAVLAEKPLSIDQRITVTVRFNVDSKGNISFLSIIPKNSEIENRVKIAFSRIGKYRTPPGGDAFVGVLNSVNVYTD